MTGLLMFIVFQQLTWGKKVQINVPKCVCHEAATRADVSLDAIVNLASKSLSINSFVGLLK